MSVGQNRKSGKQYNRDIECNGVAGATDRVDMASESDRSLDNYKSSNMNHVLHSLREIEVLSCATTQVMM